jgi:hypothetical protein
LGCWYRRHAGLAASPRRREGLRKERAIAIAMEANTQYPFFSKVTRAT